MDLTTLEHLPPWDWPANAKEMLLGALRSTEADESDRLLAAELVGDLVVIDDEVVDALLAVVGADHESETLRGHAAISLGPALEHAELLGFEEPDDVGIGESTFRRVVQSLRELYAHPAVPPEARRCILEASVRAPQDWHADTVREAYESGDPLLWKLSAVFSMRWVGGFNDQIMEALASENDDLEYEAVHAAGCWAVDAAWPHVSGLITGGTADKALLLAAIEAAARIRPDEAGAILVDLTVADDDNIADAAHEAIAMAELDDDEPDDELDDDELDDADDEGFPVH